MLHGFPEGHTERYCKTNPENISKPSYFEMGILLDGKYYSYGFEIVLSQSKIISEWLVELNSNDTEKKLFVRDIEGGTYEFGDVPADPPLADKLDVYAGDVANDTTVLFLSLMNANKKRLYSTYREVAILKDVFNWFVRGLDINYPDLPVSDYTYLVKAEQVDEVCRIISAFGSGITDFRIVDVPIEKALRGLRKTDREKIAVRLENEVARTRAGENTGNLVLIMRSKDEFFMVTIDRNGNTLCQMIEFRHGKHLSCEFIDTYLQLAAKKNIQLVVTTHESRLMDFDLLRRDEIWFMNKKNNGESDIYSLEGYNAKFDQKIDKAYLEGRYGGLPIYSTIFPVKGLDMREKKAFVMMHK